MYVDGVIGGGDNIESAKTFKDKTAKILDGAGFKLHKWHFSVAEMKEELKIETGETYAKQLLSKGNAKTKIVGIFWNKQVDQLKVNFPQCETEATKRGVLQYLASVYDPIRLMSIDIPL